MRKMIKIAVYSLVAVFLFSGHLAFAQIEGDEQGEQFNFNDNGPCCYCIRQGTKMCQVTPVGMSCRDLAQSLGCVDGVDQWGPTDCEALNCPSYSEPSKLKPLKLKLNVDIPGLSEFSGEGSEFTEKSLGTYIGGIYKFFVGVAGIVAVFMIVFGGVQWLFSGGNASKISSAQETILGAIIGLILALGSYMILYAINPRIVALPDILVTKVPIIEGDISGPVDSWLLPEDIYCPHSGGASAIPQIVNSLRYRVAYRLGGKGGPPPYPYDTRQCDGRPCREFCPENNVCLDCSGFINHVLACAGLPTPNAGTWEIFSDAERVVDLTDTSANGIDLVVGDLVGWRAEGDESSGHVLIYVGNGQVADAHGGESGRRAGGAVGVYTTTHYQDRIDYVVRATIIFP